MAEKSRATAEYQVIIEALGVALTSGDLDCFQRAMLGWFQFEQRASFPDPLLELCTNPFEPEHFSRLPPQARLYALQEIFRTNIPRLIILKPQVDFLSREAAATDSSPEIHQPFLYLLIVALLLQGKTEQAAALYTRHPQQLTTCGLEGWLLFRARDYAAAVDSFSADLAHLRQREKNPAAYFTGYEGLIFLLTLLADDNHRHLQRLKTILDQLEKIQPHNNLLPTYRIFRAITAMLENRPIACRQTLLSTPEPADDALTTLFAGLTHRWLTGKIPVTLLPVLQELGNRARRNSYAWLAEGYDSLLAGQGQLPGIIQTSEPWQNALLAMDKTCLPPPKEENAPARRLAWRLTYHEHDGDWALRPVVQHRRGIGAWSKGRPISLRRLARAVEQNKSGHTPAPRSTVSLLPAPAPPAGASSHRRRHHRYSTPEELSFLAQRDRLICAQIRRSSLRGNDHFYLPPDLDLALLVGHPYLFGATDPTVRMQLEHGRPALIIETVAPGQMLVRLTPFPTVFGQVLVRQGEGFFQVISFSPELRRLATRLGPEGLQWPTRAQTGLLDFLGDLPPELFVFAPPGVIPAGGASATPDSQVVVQFLPVAQGLRLRLRVRPLGHSGPDFAPGLGPAVLWHAINGRRCLVYRDLQAEVVRARELAALGGLVRRKEKGDIPADSWLLPDPQDCLEILTRLQEQSPAVSLEWPEGEALSISPTAELHKLHLKIGKKNDWFGLSGKLHLDDGLVMELGTLLRATRQSSGRFIALGNGRFIALSNSLRRKIDEIEAYAEVRLGEIRLHPLAARLLTESQPETPSRERYELETDHSWQEFQARLSKIEEQPAELPAGLQASLRHYQLVGYRWLRQMADLGLGACLADDMGLGKTIQALALILARAAAGPTLVVAPTSVCLNWQEEANRFAPDLRIINYSGRGRRQLLRDPGPFDLVVCSYGMLQRDIEIIAGHRWRTIVLDEAQAIKNFLAKRSRAAMKLDADFKLITTGTPLENHLAELWTLFRFINPGLLGSLEHFSKNFIIPIEQHGEIRARQRLKKLLTPFILRRLKGEVLRELPSRTEITLHVEMGREEAALYEALRRRAKANLENMPGSGGAPLQILAEIMKLRRACCHSRLVLPESGLPCAKLDLFAKVVAELLENRHRILVFSQFVDHLAIIREHLDREGISYQYFDGTTPAKARQQKVRAFQQGRGDLFLISLRAGGLGLNLTAADYVIHLDPWWNPAVEEQASDRAHRIGQQKPVTIYRLIARGTIEEKIQSLHRRKRKLAQSLLNGNRQGPPRSKEELLALLS